MDHSLIMLAYLIAVVLTPFVRRYAIRLNLVDIPNGRSVHTQPVARFGGLAILVAVLPCILWQSRTDSSLMHLGIASIAAAFLGALDDRFNLGPKPKLLIQAAIAVYLIHNGFRINFLSSYSTNLPMLTGNLSGFLTVLWIVGITNAINLIDGLDGLAAGVSCVAALVMGYLALSNGETGSALVAFALSAACLGFLRYNFHPAQIFLGDTGSLLLGLNLAAISVRGFSKGATLVTITTACLVLAYPILDTALAIARRLSQKVSPFHADRAHIHHRLLMAGLSHRDSVLTVYIVSVFAGASGALFSSMPVLSYIILLGLCVTLIITLLDFAVRSFAAAETAATYRNE